MNSLKLPHLHWHGIHQWIYTHMNNSTYDHLANFSLLESTFPNFQYLAKIMQTCVDPGHLKNSFNFNL